MQHLNVLIVEDSEDDAILAATALEQADHHVTWKQVQTLEELDRTLEEGRWDVVVSDYSMPQFNGLDALQVVRACDADMPFVIVSGRIGEEQAAAVMRAGANDYINKGRLARLGPAVDREVREAALRRSAREASHVAVLHATALASVPNAVYMAGGDGRIFWVNHAFVENTGYAPAEAIGRRPEELLAPPDAALQRRFVDFLESARSGPPARAELVEQGRDGMLRTVSATITPIADQDGTQVVVEDDITARKSADAQIEFLAHHDPLTGLPNRVLFQDRLEQAITHSRRSGLMLAVVFVDLDRFKGVNDLHGHIVGDGVLKAVGQRIADAVRREDTVARVGGDEFVLLLNDLRKPQDAEPIIRKVIDAVCEPLAVESQPVRIGASAGIALYPLDGADQTSLVRAADEAVYRAKGSGREGLQFFSAPMSEQARARVALDQALRCALDQGSLRLVYQPVADALTRRIVAVEALVRMRGSSPAEFVPLAEQIGLIRRLDEWVLRRACEQGVEWRARGVPVPRVSVNVSGLQLGDDTFVGTVESALADSGASPDSLAIEFTERTTPDDLGVASGVLHRLRDLGVELWLDDFGTGYSSLSYLSRLPVDRLKIDRSFVTGVTANRRQKSIVLAVIGMAHSLGLRVTAEGVETCAQRDFLAASGCDELQGYFIARPRAARGLEKLARLGLRPAAQRADAQRTDEQGATLTVHALHS